MPTPEQIEALSDAVWQALDDMRKGGNAVCGATKAQLRIAYEPFLQADFARDSSLAADYAPDMTLAEAEAIMHDVEHG